MSRIGELPRRAITNQQRATTRTRVRAHLTTFVLLVRCQRRATRLQRETDADASKP